jgi:hypothetical protein
MNSAVEIMEAVTSRGGQLWLDGELLRYRLPVNMESLVDTLRTHKPEIVELLSSRPAMPAGVRLLSYRPKEPPVALGNGETVIDSKRFVQATMRQLEAKLCGASGWNYGWRSLPELLERLAAVGCIVALDNPRKALQ